MFKDINAWPKQKYGMKSFGWQELLVYWVIFFDNQVWSNSVIRTIDIKGNCVCVRYPGQNPIFTSQGQASWIG